MPMIRIWAYLLNLIIQARGTLKMNEVIQNILTRRSIRTYKEEQISDEQLNVILEAGKYAPSGGNSQTWRFTVVQSKDRTA